MFSVMTFIDNYTLDRDVQYRLNKSLYVNKFNVWNDSNWIIPRPASASRALLRLIPCHRSYRSPCLCRAFGYYRLPWIDGRWVQDSRTYSPQYVWPAITSNSNFMRSSCRPQSELAPLLLRFAQCYHVASRCNGDCIMCVAQGIKGHADLASSSPSSQPDTYKFLYIHWAGRSRVTRITHDKGCVRYPT